MIYSKKPSFPISLVWYQYWAKRWRGARTPTTSAGTPINAVGIKKINEIEKKFEIDWNHWNSLYMERKGQSADLISLKTK